MTSGLRAQDVEAYLRQHVDPAATRNATGQIDVDGGRTLVGLVRWEVTDALHPALPDQQTLERLVCAAIIAAYPERAQAVQNWLTSRPSQNDPKEHAWSYMAGWYAEHGCDDFYTNLWRDPQILSELESRLRSSGAWRIAESLAI